MTKRAFVTNSRFNMSVSGNYRPSGHMTRVLRGLLSGFLPTVVLLFFSLPCYAGTFYVDANRPDNNGDGQSVLNAKRTIQAAIDLASNTDTLIILPGLYSGVGNYNLNPNGKNITIRSSDPGNIAIVKATVIDPNEAGRGFIFETLENSDCLLSGLTIKRARSSQHGGAIYCVDSSPTIKNCIITDNSAGLYGGGLYGYRSDIQIHNCFIGNNLALSDGAGVALFSSTAADLTHCIISNNQATDFGGGIYCSQSDLTVRNCTVVNNSTKNAIDSFGGGLFSYDHSHVSIKNSILWANQAKSGLGDALALIYQSTASVDHSDVQDGLAGTFTGDGCVLNWSPSTNLDSPPSFGLFDPDGDADMWDFHLKSTVGRWDPVANAWRTDNINSSCIDAGDRSSDWGEESWPHGRRINLGAYGGTVEASRHGNPADFDVNGRVDSLDLAALANQWTGSDNAIVDLNNDGVVNLKDYTVLVENWLWSE
ncbi:MAG: right-handed parallel beta-helix repeat-containing protein [Phycisphaerae bacterium]|nr:right-handed parallel beta-helix repeat-containing protein [Phycisphaerae bacterium]